MFSLNRYNTILSWFYFLKNSINKYFLRYLQVQGTRNQKLKLNENNSNI